jgi:hypothetical protein
MHLPAVDWHPARRHLRQFAWATALFLAVLSWTGAIFPWTLGLRLSAACLFAVGTVLPGILRWPYIALLLLLYLLALLFSPILRTLAPYAARRRPTYRNRSKKTVIDDPQRVRK